MNSEQANVNFKLKRVEEERDFARNHNSDLTVELSQKSAQLSDALRTKVRNLKRESWNCLTKRSLDF